ncbi:hypothetical protein INR49_011727 [Caranx melampygus]|nr:hypothetical protein INR49_011727 [Caranx melampygus]
MAAVTSPETSPQPRVYFQTPAGTTEEPETPVRKQGRVTVKYDRKELRKRLNLEEWIIDQLTDLYDCEEEAIPELEIDVDELLDMPSDVERAARVKVGHTYTLTCWLTVLSLLRTSSQSCSTRFEGCRSCPRLRRNDGVLLPTSPLPPSPHPLPSTSALTSRLPFAPLCFFILISLLLLKIFIIRSLNRVSSCCQARCSSLLSFFLCLFFISIVWIQPH